MLKANYKDCTILNKNNINTISLASIDSTRGSKYYPKKEDSSKCQEDFNDYLNQFRILNREKIRSNIKGSETSTRKKEIIKEEKPFHNLGYLKEENNYVLQRFIYPKSEFPTTYRFVYFNHFHRINSGKNIKVFF